MKNEPLTHTVNFGIGSAFSKGRGSAFFEGSGSGLGLLHKVCQKKHASKEVSGFFKNFIYKEKCEKRVSKTEIS